MKGIALVKYGIFLGDLIGGIPSFDYFVYVHKLFILNL